MNDTSRDQSVNVPSILAGTDILSPTIWTHYSFAPDWFADAVREAQIDTPSARRREIVFAVCCVESYLVEWVRDDVLNRGFALLPTYFPTKGPWRGIVKRWISVLRKLHEDGTISAVPSFRKRYWQDFTTLVDYRNGLVHGRSSRPNTTGPSVDQASEEKPEPSWGDLSTGIPARWPTDTAASVIEALHNAIGSSVPTWLVARPIDEHMDFQLELDRRANPTHHIDQARTWLRLSSEGKHTVAICYAAFELRLAVERICMQYYVKLAGTAGAKPSPKKLRSFSKMKNEIFSIAGHQKTIDRQFAFARSLLRLLEVPASAPTPNLGRISYIWSDCSEACHIFWNMTAATGLEIREHDPAYDPASDLAGYADELEVLANATAFWLQIHDEGLEELRARFEGRAQDEEELRAHLERTGAFARFVPRDGAAPGPIGTPMIPRREEEDA